MATAEAGAVEARLDQAAMTCARDGAQLTELRRTVLRLVLEAEGPLTAYQLLDRLQQTRRGAAPPTIYRALDFLMDRRLVHKLERINAYVSCTEAGRHTHPVQFLICGACGAVTEIQDAAVAQALVAMADRQGFQPQTSVVEVLGICSACAVTALPP